MTEAAFLQFALVHKDSRTLVDNDITPPGYRKYALTTKDGAGNSFTSEVLVELDNKYGLKGEYITSASPSRNPLTQEPMILFGFDSDGGAAMFQLSSENIGERMAIILDKKLISAPTLQSSHKQQRTDHRGLHSRGGCHHRQCAAQPAQSAADNRGGDERGAQPWC